MMYFYLIVLVLVAAVYRYKPSARERYLRRSKLYGCEPCPVITNSLPWGLDRIEQIFRANQESYLMELFLFHFRQWGTTMEQNFLGSQAFGTIEPRNLEAMLNTNFEDWSVGTIRRKALCPLFGDGIFTQDGDDWKRSRRLLRPRVTHRYYDDLQIFEKPMDHLISSIVTQYGTIDLQPLFFRFTLDVTTRLLFGTPIAEVADDPQNFSRSFDLAQDFVARRMRLQDMYWLIGGRRFRQACDNTHRFADQIIMKNLDSSEYDRYRDRTFLQDLADECSDRGELRSQIMNILIAGRDTTACLISWTLHHLVRHNDVMQNLRQEVTSAFQSTKSLTRSDIHNLAYLQNVLKEVLRLHPPIAVNSRTAIRDTVLPVGGGIDRNAPVFIPKGTQVAYSIYAMHRRRDLYGIDAELFRPERWSSAMPLDSNSVSSKWGYLPFNGGPRLCLGVDFSLTEAGYVIIHLLQRFSLIQLPNLEEFGIIGTEKQTMTLVLSSTDGCKVEIKN